MDPVRIALVGTGEIADARLAPALQRARGACLWSVHSRSRARAEDFAARHGARSPSPAHDTLEGLLADPLLDAVLIATPDALHAGQCVAAARAGKHVLCEKPLATTVEDAQAAVDACDRAGVTLGVAYHLRHHAGHKAWVKRLRDGAIGPLRHARVQWTFRSTDASNWRARDEAGRWWALAAVGTHAIDLTRWILAPDDGDVPAVCALAGSPRYGTARDESVTVAMRYRDGTLAEVFASATLAGTRRIEVFGDEGYAHAEWTLGPRGEGSLWIQGEPLAFEPADPYVGEIEDFVQAIRAHRAPAVDGREGARNVEIMTRALP
jgi:predicted dehydrogenase